MVRQPHRRRNDPHTAPVETEARRRVIGVDLGVKVAAALSNGELVPNPRFKAHTLKAARLQKALTKSQKDPQPGTDRPKNRRLTHLEARQREGQAHNVANRLVHTCAINGIEDHNVAGMTRSTRGTIEKPAKRSRQGRSQRSILDVAPAQIRHLPRLQNSLVGTQL
ncbi:transposase [Paeniglutamicibacter kerguelensis]|uniref:transposase n=1 Tax=Paeniglutamicibacter kerguelensis TaxID=254788 RepID=UPI00361CE22B